jgi:hypothetical protein
MLYPNLSRSRFAVFTDIRNERVGTACKRRQNSLPHHQNHAAYIAVYHGRAEELRVAKSVARFPSSCRTTLDSLGECTRRNHLGFQLGLGKIFGIERNQEVGVGLLGAGAECIVARVRGYLNRGTHSDLLGALTDQVDNSSDQVWTNTEALQNFLVLVQDVFSHQPDEVVPFRPLMKYVGARISSRDKRRPESRYAGYDNTCVDNSSRLAPSSSLRQQ